MKIIKPISFTTAMLTSSSATETIADYVAGTSYALDAEVNYANNIYVSLTSGNIGNQPNVSPTFWIRKSSNNKYSMFDEFVNTRTVATSSLTIQLQPQFIFNSIAFFNLLGNSISINITDGISGPNTYTSVISLDDTIILDWYMYFFEPYDFKTEVVIQDIPPYSSSVINITLTGASTVGIGNFVFGNIYNIGSTQYGANAGIRDYSNKETNVFGITSLVTREFSKRMDSIIHVPTGNIRFVRKLLEDIRSTPAVFVGTDSDSFDILNVYGYYKDFNMEISYPTFSLCRLEVEGLI